MLAFELETIPTKCNTDFAIADMFQRHDLRKNGVTRLRNSLSDSLYPLLCEAACPLRRAFSRQSPIVEDVTQSGDSKHLFHICYRRGGRLRYFCVLGVFTWSS